MIEPYASQFRRHRPAWKFFQEQPPYYRKTFTWWIVSAKREETRLKRLGQLIEASKRKASEIIQGVQDPPRPGSLSLSALKQYKLLYLFVPA